jgi:hypothetical protein
MPEGFASEWLRSGQLFPELIEEAPYKNTGIIIVVPSYDEPELLNLLNSISRCIQPVSHVEVLVVVNAPSNAGSDCISRNRTSVLEARAWQRNTDPFFSLHLINIENPSVKGWGVGTARKTGMDEALRRFSALGREDGVIACLDADCTVKHDYLVRVEKELLERSDRRACSVYFEHPIDEPHCPVSVRSAIIQYELHLRYYLQALKNTGFPGAFHTVGSTMAVKALAYLKSGGMNRHQAGEDFYFVQKLLPAGGYFSLNSTTVYPSPRISARVPFGTGAAVGKMTGRSDAELLTYNPTAFNDLAVFFGINEKYLSSDKPDSASVFSSFPASVKEFCSYSEYLAKTDEIRSNTSTAAASKKRFFEWFNMFRVVKYLNFSHSGNFTKIPVLKAAVELIEGRGGKMPELSAEGILFYFREIDRVGS